MAWEHSRTVRSAVSILTMCLLVVAIMEVRHLRSMIVDANPSLAGQSVTQSGVTTERLVGETLEDWARRHRIALEVMGDADD